MSYRFCFLYMLMLLSGGAGATETARDYYNELLNINGFNPLATFVCFPDEQTETFFLMGRSSQFEETLKAKGKPVDAALQQVLKQTKGNHELLYWQGFDRGVGSELTMLQRGASISEWIGIFDAGKAKSNGKLSLRITWPSLRYRLAISIKDEPGEFDAYGRCEPIPEKLDK